MFTELIVLDSQGLGIAKRQSLYSCIHYLFIQQIFIKRSLCAGVSVLGSGAVSGNKSESVPLKFIVNSERQVNKETGKYSIGDMARSAMENIQ